ncbi:Oar protein [Mesoterricola sediminis]|uniref:Oar protein n=2 Tax=Mesoterricola sediminis TaxID=2927980 RepID=A0AA48GYX8_9BACT|nr:Oar protein [Mesoterricola sediminis]
MHSSSSLLTRGRLCALLIGASPLLIGQTSAVGHVTGTVARPDGSPAVGQAILVETPRGARELRTDEKGQFRLPNLVPGKVVVKVHAAGMMDFRSEVLVMVNQTTALAIRLKPQASTTVEVVAINSSVPLNTTDLDQSKTGFTTTMEQIDNLPIPLTTTTDRLSQTLLLVPGTNTGYAYHGASNLAYNVDGVDTTDSNYGQAITQLNNDLLDQVQVMTGGVSAKYGRFDGALVAVTTRSGSNAFEGSMRMVLSNPKWQGLGKTPELYKALGISMTRSADATTTIQSYTFLGPILKDRLFFSLGYQTYSPEQKTYGKTGGFVFSGLPYVASLSEERKDAKLDWIVDTANRISFQWNASETRSENRFNNLGNPSTLETLSGLKREKRGYYSVGWTSQLTSSLLLDLKYNDAYYKSGGPGTGSTGGALVPTWKDMTTSTLFDNGTFSSEPEERHQKVFSLGVTWFAHGMGEHQVEAGVQGYEYTLESAALDFPSGYLISFNGFVPGASTPALANRVMAVQNAALTSLVWQVPVHGKSNTKNKAVYLNDTWTLDKHLSFNLGLRYDGFTSDTTPENNHYSASALAPRLAVNVDLAGDKRHVVSFTAAEYASQILQSNLAGASVTKTPITRTYLYVGTGGANQGLGTDALTSTGAINWAAWGKSAGVTGQANPVTTQDPIQNRTTFVDPNLKAPRTRELTLGYRHEIPQQAFSATLVRRWMDRFVDDIWYGDGIAPGRAKIIISNDPDGKRDYYGLELTYRNNAIEHVSFGGNLTWSRSLGNDSAVTGGQANNFGNGISRDRLAPQGPTASFDRPFILHADATYQNTLGQGRYNFSLLGSYFSRQISSCPWGTANTPANLVAQGYAATYRKFFPELGVLHQPEYFTLDLQIGYEHPIAGKAKAFGKVNILNILNYMPTTSIQYYGTAYAGPYVPFTLYDGKGVVNQPARSFSFDLGIRF